MALMLKDHDKLHESIVRAVLAGGAAAVAGVFLPAYLGAAATALALGVAVAVPKSWPSAAWALLWACAAGAAIKLGGPIGATAGALAVGASVARGVNGAPLKLLTAGLGALGAATAAMIGRAVGQTEVLAFLPSGLEALAVGAASGLVVGVSSIGRNLARLDAPLEADLIELQGEGELGQLLGRAAGAYRQAVEALGDQAPTARAAADDLISKMTRFGRRWSEVESQAARSLPADLKERLEAIDRRIETCEDPVARAEFERAREALSAQVAYLDEIRQGRERAVARLTHQVATLERLRLAAVRHRSVDATRLGLELQPVVEEISEAGGDFDLASEALTEAGQTSAAPSLPPASSAN